MKLLMENDCLSIDLARFLQKLGISLDNASMYWKHTITAAGFDAGYILLPYTNESRLLSLDCLTLTITELLELLPKWLLSQCTGGYELHVIPFNWDYALPFPKLFDRTVLGVVYKMICYLKRKELL